MSCVLLDRLDIVSRTDGIDHIRVSQIVEAMMSFETGFLQDLLKDFPDSRLREMIAMLLIVKTLQSSILIL